MKVKSLLKGVLTVLALICMICACAFTLTACGELGSKSLEYTLNEDGESYCLTGIGTCTDTDIVIPSTYNGKPVTSIGGYAFYDCSSLTSITIPDSVTSIGGSAFKDCSSLTSITIPDSVTSIGAWAFTYCSSLTNVTIGNSVTSIGDCAFKDCSSLTSITIPDSVTSIGDYAFYGCVSLTEINYNATACADLGSNGVFSYTGNNGYGIKVTIGKNVKKIPAKLFYDGSSAASSKITEVVFDEGSVCESIGYWAFAYCSSLTSITIPNSVTSIGDYAFYHCSSLTSVTIGNSVTNIEYGAFAYCNSLTSVTFKNTSGWYVSTSSTATSGTNLTLTDASQNAKYLKSTYYNYYWKRS